MAKRNRKKRKRGSRRPSAERPKKRELTPAERLPATFRVMFEVAHAADEAGRRGGIPATPKARFEMNLLVRGVNALKAARLLLTESHWEVASAAARQLFELVVNVEYLRAQDDQEEAVARFAKFGVLQALQEAHTTLLYEQRTGRPIDEAFLAQIDHALDHSFPEFRTVTKGGRVRWATSWCGVSTRGLAKDSPMDLRIHQYEQLFSAWSEQVHAAPGALARTLLNPGIGRTIDDMLTKDESQVVQVGTMAVLLFVELWVLLDAMPQPDPQRFSVWNRDLATESARYVSLDRLSPDDPFFKLLGQQAAGE